ncbi:hypothetical protein [Streptomyces sp. NPDC001880]
MSFRVRADSKGLTLSRALLRRRYHRHNIAGLDMTFDEDPIRTRLDSRCVCA